MRVVIADDHPATRAGIRFALQPGGIEIVAEVANADAAVAAVAEFKPDVALIDINMPGDGITAIHRITREHSNVACIVVTASDDDEHLFKALKAGAAGYVLKDTDLDRLPLALEAVLKGESVLPRSLVMRVAQGLKSDRSDARRSIPGVESDLTEREWDVMKLLRKGLSTNQIAEQLEVSQVTVRSHVSAIVRKLQVNDRNEAIQKLQENGSLDTNDGPS